MSTIDAGANQSTDTQVTSGGESTNQSVSTAAPADTKSEADFERELDEDWGLEVPDDEFEEEPVGDDDDPTDEGEPIQNPEEEPVLEDDVDEPADDDLQGEETGPFLRVNYLGQAQGLSEEEARVYAQIGMNSARLQERYNALKPLEPLRDTIEVLARFRGQTFDEVVKSLGSMDDLRRSEIDALVADGHDPALAEEVFEGHLKNARQKYELERMKNSNQQGLNAFQLEQVMNFRRFRPEVDADVSAGGALPDDVVTEWRNGTDLTTAWLLHESNEQSASIKKLEQEKRELTKQLKAARNEAAKLKKSAENKAKAPTRKKGTGGGNGSGIDIFEDW